MIEFTVPGIAKGQPRVKTFSRGGHAGVYTPKTADAFKLGIWAAATPVKPATPLRGAVAVWVHVYFPWPKKWYTKKGLRPNAPRFQTGKPDVDNLAKPVLDVLTQMNFWEDDAQVYELLVVKHYDSEPHTTVSIWTDKKEEK